MIYINEKNSEALNINSLPEARDCDKAIVFDVDAYYVATYNNGWKVWGGNYKSKTAFQALIDYDLAWKLPGGKWDFESPLKYLS